MINVVWRTVSIYSYCINGLCYVTRHLWICENSKDDTFVLRLCRWHSITLSIRSPKGCQLDNQVYNIINFINSRHWPNLPNKIKCTRFILAIGTKKLSTAVHSIPLRLLNLSFNLDIRNWESVQNIDEINLILMK